MSESVRYPMARWEVMFAVASLADPDHQVRVWINHVLPQENYYDSLDQAVHTLFDDWAVIQDPQASVGSILIAGPEIERLRALGQLLDILIGDLGDQPDSDYLRDIRWPQVVDLARSTLAAMVLAGPFQKQPDE